MSYTDLPQEQYEMGADRIKDEWIRISEAEPEFAAVQAYAPGVGILKGDYIGYGMMKSHGTGYEYSITHWTSIDAGPMPAPKEPNHD